MVDTTKSACNLSDVHRFELALGSGIPDEIIEQRGYWTATTKSELGCIGFSASQQSVPALVIPLLGVDGDVVGHQCKPDRPRLDRKKGKPIKYETPSGASVRLDIPPNVRNLLGNPKVPLWITEGVKKGDSAASRGLCCITLTAVYNTRGKNEYGVITELSDWDRIAITGRLVYIAFDSDSATNSNVNHAMRKLGSMLKRRGASSVRCVLIPTPNGSKVGLDDWFVSGGTVQDLVNASKEELPAIRRSRTQPSPKEYRLTEYGNAERLVDSNREDIRYCASLDRWLIWNGRHWEIDNDRAAAVYRRAAQVILDMIIEAGKTQDEDARKAILAHARRSDNYRVHQNMIYLASKMEGIPISAEDLDKGSGLLNLADCALDLTTFEMRPHRREDYLTRLIDIPYNPHGGCKRWVEFLETILQGKTELLRYVHKAAGYSLTGENSEKCFFFLYGNRGDNGKSVFIDTLMSIMGPYASSTPTSTLIAKKNEGSIPNDLARLKGIRFVAASETGENKRLDEELIKSLTGKDRISARFMRAEWFDFTPQFAIWMTGNHKPIIRGQDTAIWNRVKLIPFTYCVPKRDRDRDLREKILKEKEGILAWLIEGCKAWRAEGLDDPLEITGAVESYRDEMDDLGEFLRQCTEQGDSYICMASHLYDTYKRWCARNGPKPISSTAFGTQIGYRGIPKRRVAAGMLYEGLRAVKEDFLLEMAYENCAM